MLKLQPKLDGVPQVAVSGATSTEDSQLDAIIVQIGQFGRFQVTNYLLLCLPIICNAFYSISYIFTASNVAHRCNITQCDSSDSSYSAPFLNFTTPQSRGAWDQCQHYALSSEIETASAACNESNFNQSELISCEAGFKLVEDERTIASEFGIFCGDQWKLSMVGTVNNIGQFVGIPLGGYLADRYGRKSLLVIGGILSAFAGLARSHAPNYYSFLGFEFLDMAVGSTLFPTAFLMALELVGPKHRVVAATSITLTYGLAEAALGYLADFIRDWRVLLRVLYTPALLHLIFICLLPESVRWLLSQSKELDAMNILRKVARVNRKSLSEQQLTELMRSNRQLVAKSSATGGHYSLRQIVHALGWRIAQCCFVWFTHTFIALGLSLNSSELKGSKFENFSMMGFMQLPGSLLATVIMHRIGRRWALTSCMASCTLFLLAVPALQEAYPVTSSVLYFMAKMTSTGSFVILYFFTSEIFPTNCRNSLLSFCSMVGRFGSMLAPQTPLLIPYYTYAPHFLFALFGFVCACLTLYFPETTNKALPTTLEEARSLDRSMPKPLATKSAV
ncbi:solute carrier family 22 member 3-like [Drosophila miranda]|uniref:solute carrier family 22 member 3-like n=1 Tax=Drosophila miranda TaxID=7229 RepID=UPI0007E82390|nr:solute carrier family 22 member 3-like [Drosophila miranda]